MVTGSDTFRMSGLTFEGTRYDCGDKAGFQMANLSHAMDRPEMRAQLEPFIKTRFVSGHYAHFTTGYEPDATWLWPYTLADEEQFGHYESFERIPHGELAVHRGNQVMATDGPVGTVEEFFVTPDNHHLTHLVLREEEQWGENDVTVPITAVDHVKNDIVYLNLDTASITQQQPAR